MQGYFRVILRIRFVIVTTKIVQNTTFTPAFVRNVRFGTCMFPLGEAQKKKTVEARSRDLCRAISELSFEIGSSLSLQRLCKIPLSHLSSFEMSDLVPARFPLERQKKKTVEARSRDQCTAISELSFELDSSLSLQ